MYLLQNRTTTNHIDPARYVLRTVKSVYYILYLCWFYYVIRNTFYKSKCNTYVLSGYKRLNHNIITSVKPGWVDLYLMRDGSHSF